MLMLGVLACPSLKLRSLLYISKSPGRCALSKAVA